jgi:ubiquinone/menaquinone biosynthesis C-methylase UbiE
MLKPYLSKKMTDTSLLLLDETSQKYFRFSTKWITGIFIKRILSYLKKTNPKTILDVGCGTGYLTNIIQNTIDADIVCCDWDLTRLSFAKKWFNLETILADINYLPFKTSSFDMVIAMEIIEHIPNKGDALSEIGRVSEKNVIITVPNDPLFMVANLLRGKNIRSFGNPPDHINHFNKKYLKLTLSAYFPKIEISKNAFFWLIANIDK